MKIEKKDWILKIRKISQIYQMRKNQSVKMYKMIEMYYDFFWDNTFINGNIFELLFDYLNLKEKESVSRKILRAEIFFELNPCI